MGGIHRMPDPTCFLVRRAQAGDSEALQEIFGRYSARILAIARLRLGGNLRGHLESVDVAQSVLLDAFKNLGDFRGETEGAFLHWMSRMIENKIRDKADYFGAAKRTPPSPLVALAGCGQDDGSLQVANTAASGDTPSVKAAINEDVLRLNSALSALPEDYKEVIILARYEGLSFGEIAKHLGKSPDACRMLLGRALTRLTEVFMMGGTHD
jgi:RNA polymerase sigma-70 factor (subfamily 1)